MTPDQITQLFSDLHAIRMTLLLIGIIIGFGLPFIIWPTRK